MLCIFFCCIGFLGVGCSEGVIGSGNVMQRSFSVKPFERVVIHSSLWVGIKKNTSYSASATIDENLLSLLQVEQEGKTLHIFVFEAMHLLSKDMLRLYFQVRESEKLRLLQPVVCT